MRVIKLLQITLLLSLIMTGSCTVKFIRELLQYNIFGIPVLHKKTNWVFDPDEAIRRSRQYQELNGRFGALAIERLGLGIDGYDQERREQQRARDRQLLREEL